MLGQGFARTSRWVRERRAPADRSDRKELRNAVLRFQPERNAERIVTREGYKDVECNCVSRLYVPALGVPLPSLNERD